MTEIIFDEDMEFEDFFPPADAEEKDDDSSFAEEKEFHEEIDSTEDQATNSSATEDNEEDELSTSLFEVLKSEDLLQLPQDFEFKKTPASLKEALQLTKERLKETQLEELTSSAPEEFKEVINYLKNGGRDLNEFVSNFSSADDYNLDTASGQKKVLIDYYKLTSKHSDAAIKRMVQRIEEMDDLEVEAKDALIYINEYKQERRNEMIEQLEEEKIFQQEKAKQESRLIEETINKYEADSPRKSKIKSVFFNSIIVDGKNTTPFAYKVSQLMSKPEHLIQFADLLVDYDSEKGFNTERLLKQKQTKQTQSFKEKLNQKVSPNAFQRGSVTKGKSDFDWDSFINS